MEDGVVYSRRLIMDPGELTLCAVPFLVAACGRELQNDSWRTHPFDTFWTLGGCQSLCHANCSVETPSTRPRVIDSSYLHSLYFPPSPKDSKAVARPRPSVLPSLGGLSLLALLATTSAVMLMLRLRSRTKDSHRRLIRYASQPGHRTCGSQQRRRR